MDRAPTAASRQSSDAVRRLAVVAALLAGACASIGAPPGGPQRDAPPALEKVTPDSGAVNVRADHVTFDFDVVVSDRPTGVPTLEDAFVISPRDGQPKVSWGRDHIDVRSRRGFLPNTAYSVTMLPGIADLRGNAMKIGRTIVFSTGPTIPHFAVHGRVFDWMSERVAPKAIVDVIRRPDSLPYIGTADSSGQFSVGPLGEGTYTVRAFLDNNSNRALDPLEPWDSVRIAVRATSPFLELLAAPRDTIPPRVLIVTPRDSTTLVLSFDRPLDPALPLTPEAFRVVDADSTQLRIMRVRPRARTDAQQPDRTPGDTSARRDTTARGETGAERTAADTTRAKVIPKPSMPAPPRDVIVQLDSLTPMRDRVSYRVSATGVRGLLGASRASDRVITFERARPDSTGARRP